VRSPAAGDLDLTPFGFTVALRPLTWRNRLILCWPGGFPTTRMFWDRSQLSPRRIYRAGFLKALQGVQYHHIGNDSWPGIDSSEAALWIAALIPTSGLHVCQEVPYPHLRGACL